MDYEEKLDRAYENMEQNTLNSNTRFNPPNPQYEIDGNFTIYRNLNQTAKYINRDVEELFTFIKKELGTNGSYDEKRGRFKGDFDSDDLQEVLDEFIEKFVTCSQCGSPDTKYQIQAGVSVIKCTACGATQPKPE